MSVSSVSQKEILLECIRQPNQSNSPAPTMDPPQDLTKSSKRRGILRGGDTGTHTCTVIDGGMTERASTNITITGKCAT